jgi:predicted component of type VI protein secretion system
MSPILLALTDGPDIPLDKPIMLVGRHQECDVQIPSRKVSRRHCCVAQVHDYVVVKDLFSTNGVRINGTRVKEGALQNGDELTIGNYRYKIQTEDYPAADQIAKRPAASGKARSPNPTPAHQLESCDVPMALAEGKDVGPVPQSLPLVLPVNATIKPLGIHPNIGLAPLSGEFRAGPPPK